MPDKNSQGLAHILIVVIVVIILGVLTVIATSSRRSVTVNSREDVESVLAKDCPSDEELAAAERYIRETGLDDLADDLAAARNKPECSIIQQIIGNSLQSTSVSVEDDDDPPKKCPHFGVGPKIVRVVNNNPYIGEWVSCYDVYDIRSRKLLQSNVCETLVGNEDEFEEWYLNFTTPYGKLWEDDCRYKWGDEFDIPVGFEDQYDFSDYQTEEYVPPLEPLTP